MSHARFAASLLLAEQAAISPLARRDFTDVARLAEASVASATTPWRHAPVGAAPMRKKGARVALVRLLETLPWWWARTVLAAWRRERPMRAAERWCYGRTAAQRAVWMELLARAGRAAALAEGPTGGDWVGRVVEHLGQIRGGRSLLGDPRWLAAWLDEATREGWRPPGVEIVLHTGPMGSGKSTALVKASEGAVVIQSLVNSRDGSAIRTHDGVSVQALATGCLWRAVWAALYPDSPDQPSVVRTGCKEVRIVVDEGQWFDRDDWVRALGLCLGHRVTITVGALDWSAQRTRLGSAEWLLGAADTVEWHRGLCVDCAAPSTITRWDGEGPPGVGVIGVGAYRPVCDGCWRAPGWGGR